MNYKDIYKDAVNDLNPSPMLMKKIKTGKENRIMKFSRKKAAVVAAIACMAMGTTAFAAGHITGYVSWGDPRKTSTSFSSVTAFADKNDLDVTIPETLSNGYTFDSSNAGGMKGVDDAGNALAKGEFFTVNYKRAGSNDISLFINPAMDAQDYSDAVACRNIDGVDVYYNEDAYKFVPRDYEETEDDKAREAAGHFYISVGADTVETTLIKSVIFEENGKIYHVQGYDSDMNAEEWFGVAEDLLK